MNTKIKLSLLLIMSAIWVSCEDPNDDSTISDNDNDNNLGSSTLEQSLTGASDPIAAVFFDLTDESLNYTYDYYTLSGIGYGNTIDLPCSIRETDVVNFYTFPEYLIEAQNCQYDNCGWCNGNGLEIDINQSECEASGGSWIENSNELDDASNYVLNSLLDETYETDGGILCTCYCIDNDGDVIDCGNQNAVSRYYPSIPTSGACQNNIYTTPSECLENGWVWFDEYIDCSLMDVNQDCVMEDAQDTGIINQETAEFSSSYTNLEKLVWDIEAGRYKPQVSSEITEEVTLIDESDVYDISRYWTIINEWENLDGKVYIDHSQWNDTTIIYEEQVTDCESLEDELSCISAGAAKGCNWNGASCEVQICNSIIEEAECIGNCTWLGGCFDDEYPVPVDVIIDQTFQYTASILNPDSLMFRINSDCNNDGTWTEAESYEDVGVDGCPDQYEDGNGGCVCDYPDFCSNEDIQTGGDLNEDNWQFGAAENVFTENNGQYDCVSPYCNIELSLDSYRGEPFIDRVDNLPSAEIYWDIPIGDTEVGNGQWQGQELEPWQDLNCNLIYDDLADGTGNGVWDDDEIYQNLDGIGTWEEGDPLYRLSDTPNQIIVNYDTNNDGVVNELDGPAEVVSEIDPDEINSAMVYLNGGFTAYSDIIKEEFFEDYYSYKYTPIDEIVTVFSNEIIEDVPVTLLNDEYSIAKTYWETFPDGTDVNGDGISDRYYDYDYHLFRYSDDVNGNLLKLVHPDYYYNPNSDDGFPDSPDDVEEGFFETSDLIEDIMVYVVGNNLREGEYHPIETVDSVDVDGDGAHDHVYDVTKVFEVFYEIVDIPLRSTDEDLGIIIPEGNPNNKCGECSNETSTYTNKESCENAGECSNSDFLTQESCENAGLEWSNYVWTYVGEMIVCASDGKESCVDLEPSENDCGESIEELSQCSPYLSLPAYKVIRTKNSILHGPGVEYGERNTVWLSEGYGIVKDKLEIRWSGQNGDIDNWTEYSRLELKSIDNSQSGFNLGRLFNSGKVIEINNFENEEGFNSDPYIPNPTAIIQRVRHAND